MLQLNVTFRQSTRKWIFFQKETSYIYEHLKPAPSITFYATPENFLQNSSEKNIYSTMTLKGNALLNIKDIVSTTKIQI